MDRPTSSKQFRQREDQDARYPYFAAGLQGHGADHIHILGLVTDASGGGGSVAVITAKRIETGDGALYVARMWPRTCATQELGLVVEKLDPIENAAF